MDPYVACSLLVDTICLESKMFEALATHYDTWRHENELTD